MSNYRNQFITGAHWDWHHTGPHTPGNGTLDLEFTSNNKVRWNSGGEQGSWRIIDEYTMFTSFNGVEHVLTKNKENEEWILIVPVR